MYEKNYDRPNNQKERIATIISPPDIPLLIIIACLAMVGLMAVFSSSISHGIQDFNDHLYFFKKQLLNFTIGFFGMVYFIKFNYKKFQNKISLLTMGTIGLLVATHLFGSTIYGSKRWLFFCQPSEFAKFTCVAIMADALVHSKSLWDEYFLKRAFSVLIIFILIMLQPDLGTTIVVFLGVLATCIIGGISMQLLSTGLIGFTSLAIFSIINMPHQRERIEGWLNPWADQYDKGYNLIQSWYAISAGGFWGAGFGNSKQKLLWLPLGHIDFIFAIFSEEMGFLGCLVLLGLFLGLMHRGFMIAKRCPDPFGKLLAFGITCVILAQALLNICVAVGLLPVTGVTLPLVSYGGTSAIVTLSMFGVLLNISRQKIKRIKTNV
jgi:cell division protein FtsW